MNLRSFHFGDGASFHANFKAVDDGVRAFEEGRRLALHQSDTDDAIEVVMMTMAQALNGAVDANVIH